MIREDIRQLKTGPRDLRKFGWLVGGVLAVLGALFWARHKAHYPFFFWPGVALLALGTLAPRTLKYLYVGWMSVAIVLGFIVSNIILTLFFFLVIMPVGLLARMTGKDFLSLKLEREASTYWISRRRQPRTQGDYEKQF